MKLSTRTRYGLRILMQIAFDSESMPSVKGKDIARKQSVSEAYLEQIMIPLKKIGLVKTVRGCQGGYLLKKSADSISVLDIIKLFEDGSELVKCCGDDGSPCKRADFCAASEVWQHLNSVLFQEAEKIKLSALVQKMKAGHGLDYSI